MKTKILGFILFLFIQYNVLGQAVATSNYATQTGALGTSYSWIDTSGGTQLSFSPNQDDGITSIPWPFDFSFYDNRYTSTSNLSIASNGYIRLDGDASTNYTDASNYNLGSNDTDFGQIIALAIYDGNTTEGGSTVKYLVTGNAPNRILTIEYSNLEISWSDNVYASVQVSFYETSDKIVLKLGADNIYRDGVDMGLHSGVNSYFHKWQEVRSGTNNTYIEYTRTAPVPGPAASWNYGIQTGNNGTIYDWIDCSSGSNIVSGQNSKAEISWPFNFRFYDNNYTTSDNLSVATNGFIRLDGIASTNNGNANNYDLISNATQLGQIIAMGVNRGRVRDNGGYVRSLVTGSFPNRIFTIEFHNREIRQNANRFASSQISFYESSNKIVLKLGADNITQNGADMGIHSGVNSYFDKWQEVSSGTNNTWIEYTPPFIEVNATVGVTQAYYSSLKGAFDKINDGTHRGEIDIKINDNTTESSSAILNASGNGNANYNTVIIYPTKTGLSISGNLAEPLIDLNGADNVTINGRVNGIGSTIDLNIINNSTSASNGTSTIRFINEAQNNTLEYCEIKGSELNTASGIIFFSTTNFANGNNSNTIRNNNITTAFANNRPINSIYSFGTAGRENRENTIENNNIYNFFNSNIDSNGVLLANNTNAWTISGNSFYETLPFTATGFSNYSVIKVLNNTGEDFKILNNYIGGSDKQGTGSAWTKTNATNNVFNAISLNVGSSINSSIQNNTIKNFNWNNSGNANWTGIQILGGNVNVGTLTGNTIGSTTANGLITVSGNNSDLNIYGISILSTGTVICENNNIGSITSSNSATSASNIYGIYKSLSLGTTTISNNIIGSATIANNINASSTSSNNAQRVYGVFNEGIGNVSIANNSISNLTNGTTNSSNGNLGVVQGITSTSGTVSVSNNNISSLSIANANTNSTNHASVAGISLTGTTSTKTIKGNTVYNLSNTYSSFSGSIIGLYYSGSTVGTNIVSENFIHSLSAHTSSTAASIYGIKIANGSSTFANNIISLGGNTETDIYGIYENGIASNNSNIYFNTIYIEGNVSSGSNKSYALFSNIGTNTRDIRNNIFMNVRSTSGGSNLHYAAYFNYLLSTNITLDYNDYFVSGAGGTLGFWNGSNKASIPIITGQDANSLNVNPTFKNAGGTVFSDYITSATLPGITNSITLDYEAITRDNPPKMGALESSLPFVWVGGTSTEFATASNWANGAVPLNGADIEFDANPINDCYLDSNRTIRRITNTSSKKFVLNGKQLTLTGELVSATMNQVDATASSSMLLFAGNTTQELTSSKFVSNTLDGLTINNSNGLTQNGAITVESELTLTNGVFSIGANTLTLNGNVSTTLGTLVGGSTSNIIVSGSGASTNFPSVTVNDFTLNRTNGISLEGDVTVTGDLDLTNGSLTLSGNTLTIATNTINKTGGDIVANQTSDTVDFQNITAFTMPAGLFSSSEIENFTISGAGGITINNNLTVNGVLNLQNSNPSATKGLLHVFWTDDATYNELIMSPNSTTEGQGDVSGVISRNAFVEGKSYAFGSKNSLVTFNPGAIALPTELKVRVTIGTAQGWLPTPIKRTYDLIQTGGNNSIATFRTSYLDSELNGNTEDELSFWTPTDRFLIPPPVDSGKSNFDINENWLALADVNISFFPPVFGYLPITMDESNISYKQWIGEYSTDWNNPLNWFPSGVPDFNSFVRIPDAAITNFDPTLPPGVETEIEKIILDSGSVLNSGAADNAKLTVNDNIGSWSNNGGTFNPGNSTVNFLRRDDSDQLVTGFTTISGSTTFYNIEIGEKTTLLMGANSSIEVAGAITINEVGADRGVLSTSGSGNTTVNYTGGNQTVVVPDTASNTYSTLILSGTGVKTLPNAALEIGNYFVLTDSAIAMASSSITVDGEMYVGPSATFTTGVNNHFLKDNLNVEGTFTTSVGSKITFNGIQEQLIFGSASIEFEDFEINNTAGIKLATNIEVNNNLILLNGNLIVDAVELGINGAISKTSGFIQVDLVSSLAFANSSSLTLPNNLFFGAPSFNNLTINSAGGVIMGEDLTVNGILNLSANPSATIGSLDTGSSTLFMGATGTTIGLGDVTGIVRREHTFTNNTKYSFGNAFTDITFYDANLKPTWIAIKIAIGTVPTWTGYTANGKVKRLYQIARSENSSTSLATINMHYLPTELDGTYNDDSQLTFWHKYVNYLSGTPHEHGPSNQDFVNYSLQVTGLPLGTTVTENFNESEVTMAYSLSTKNTWLGIVAGNETEWEQPLNWTGGHVPLSTEDVLIPGGLTYYPSLTPSASAVAGTIEIALEASITANSHTITISGAGGAWDNRGTFNPGTGKVLFNHGIPGEIVTISGETNFHNIEVAANTTFQPVAGNVLRISGAGTAYMSSIVDMSSIDNTVEWNGGNQNIVNPNGIGGDSGFYNLIISGSGTKTMPTTAMYVNGNLGIAGTTSVTAGESIIVKGNTSIGAGSSFTTGNFNHLIGGDFENNGTLTGTSGGRVTFNGNILQTFSGSSSNTFDNLTIDNLSNINLSSNVTINSELLLLGGDLAVGSETLGINGTINNPSGALDVNSNSNLNFGGSTAIVLNDNLFTNNPVVNDVTINRSGGVTLGNQNMEVSGVLTATDGTLTLDDNTLTFSGSSPARTSGNIDASSTNSVLIFSNTSVITLPDNLFTGDITNLNVNGTGGVISNGDLSITGILHLESGNPSATKGSLDMAATKIIDMSVNATTVGLGDVTGIVRREHTFSGGIEYTFGNEFTSMNFLNVPGGIKPKWIKCKISIGAPPTWNGDVVDADVVEVIERYYSFSQFQGDMIDPKGTDRMILKLHYLDTELNGLNESQLAYWDAYDPNFGVNNFVEKYARSFNDRNINDNWVQLNGPSINYISTSDLLDVKQWGLGSRYDVHLHTWTGSGSPSFDGDWSLPGNWKGGVPVEICPVLIPHPSTLPTDNNGDNYPARNLLPILTPSKALTLEIASGAVFEIEEDYNITIFGKMDAWVNNGTFIPGTATVIFDHPYDDDLIPVSISGTTDFYDITITDETFIQPTNNSIVRIENSISSLTSSILDFSTTTNTIEYNGLGQGIVNPNGGTTGYYNLSLSGSGIKSLPTETLQIINDFSLSESASAISKNDLTVGNDLNISNTSNLSISADKTLTVNGNINNSVGNSGLVLKSTSDGTASLIHNTNNVPATVERYISGAAEDWHFLSAPVSNQLIAPITPTTPSWVPSGTYGNGTGYDLYVWDEPTPCWVYHDGSSTPSWGTVHPQTNFIPGRGYLYSVQATNPTKEFKGNLNNGIVSYAITANCPCTETENTDLEGFNLIGNPYPSSIDWSATTGWTRSNLLDSGSGYDMWIWNPAANNYGVFNSNGLTGSGTNGVTEHIPPMQGFFVRAISNANITMTNTIRLHDGASNWLKPSNSKNNTHNLKVQIASDAKLGFDEVLIQFGNSSNTAGAAKLFSTIETAPSVYLTLREEKLSVKYLTDTIDNPFVPLEFKPGAEGNYTLNIKDFDYSKYNYIILEDTKTKTFHDLLNQPNYNFKSSLKDDTQRFVLHFKPQNIEVPNNLLAKIYYNGEKIVVDLTHVPEKTDIHVYDMLGKMILQTNVAGGEIHYLTISKTNQVLIVAANSVKKSINKKIVVY